MAHGRADEVRRFTSIRTGLGVLTGGERRVQLVVALALMAGLAYLTWRLAFTLDGAPRWLELPLIAAEGWGFLQLGSLAIQAWRVPRFQRPSRAEADDAAVLVLGANASAEALERTLRACREIDESPPVLVTDPAHRADVAQLTEQLGARYVVTDDSLEAGLAAMEAALVLVLQGGQVPLADIFEATLGHFDAEDVAVVQCRTGLANRNALTYVVNGRSEEDLFNEVIGPALGATGDAPWGGSASVVRRSVIRSLEPPDPVNGASQAVRTTIRLRAAGYRVKFHAEPLVQAVRPDTLDAYLNRGHRRAFANLRVLATRDNPLIARGLRLRQRLLYFAAISRYFSGVHRFVLLAVLTGTLASGQLPFNASLATAAAFWLPAHLLGGLAGLALGRGTLALGDRTRHTLRSMEAYSAAAVRALTPVLPTRPRQRRERDEGGVRALGRLQLLTLTTLALDALLIARGLGEWTRDVLPPFDGREIYAALIFGVFVLAPMMDVLQLMASRRAVSGDFRHPVNLRTRVGFIEARAVDLTPRGLGIELPATHAEQLPRGNAVALELELPRLDGGAELVRLHGIVRRCEASGETASMGLEITDLDPERHEALNTYYWVTRPTRLARGLDRHEDAQIGRASHAPSSSEAVGSRRARSTVGLATVLAVTVSMAAFPAAGFAADGVPAPVGEPATMLAA